MPQIRNPMTLLIIGTAIGAVLGVVIGIAIGQASASAGARVTSIRTVVSTRTIRVPGLGETPVSSLTTTSTTPLDTTTTDTTPAFTTPTETTPTFTTPTDTTTTTTPTTTSGVAPNDVPPADPYNPPRSFCTTHVCEPGFSKGFGLVVQCADGVWSMQGGQTNVCRNDGGLP